MVKEPRPGRVKTRLARGIGTVAAAWWFRQHSAALLRRLRDRRWRLVLAVAPDQALTSRIWPADLPRLPQGRGGLGPRMARALAVSPRAPVCVIGGDIPGLSRAHIAGAFTLLGRHDAVFGPAEDGGFWLVGVKRGALARPDMFGAARWSTPHALADSVAALSGWRIGFADTLADVDEPADLRRAAALWQ